MMLEWKDPISTVDPFEAVVGHDVRHEEHHAVSTFASDDDLQAHIKEVLVKGLGLVAASTGPNASQMLILWDAAFCVLTVLATDENCSNDATHVARCSFPALEKRLSEVPDEHGDGAEFDQESERISAQVRAMTIESLKDLDLSVLPETMPVLFSDEHRASVGVANFVTETLAPARSAG